MARFLAACVRARLNIVVSGGTGSGKTTTLNVLSSFIPGSERIVTIEDTAELQLQQDHLVTLESRPANIEGKGQFTIRELVINSLRMRPDRIIVGEVRGGEAFDMLQAMNTGHDGSISTLHANNPQDALARLETMILMAGIELPLRAIREQIGSAVELVVQQSRLSDGSRKITKISEVAGLKKDKLVVNDIFVFQQSSIDEEGRIKGEYRPTGVVPRCLEKLKACGEEIATDGTFACPTPEESCFPALKGDLKKKYPLIEKGLGTDAEKRAGSAAVLTANNLILSDVAVSTENTVYATKIPERRIGFLADIPGSYAHTSGDTVAKTGAGPQPTVNYSEEEAFEPATAEKRGPRRLLLQGFAGEVKDNEDQPLDIAGKVKESESRSGDAMGEKGEGGFHPSDVKQGTNTWKEEDARLAATADDAVMPADSAAKTQNTASAAPAKNAAADVRRPNGWAVSIPPGRRGMALPINESGGLYSHLQPGDQVDVLVIYNNQAAHMQQAARTVAQNAVVLEIPRNNIQNDVENNPSAPRSITLAVTPAQAELLAYACFQGVFYLTLCPVGKPV